MHLLEGLLTTLACTILQAFLVAVMVHVLHRKRVWLRTRSSLFANTTVICVAVAALFAGMVAQVTVWAVVFLGVPEAPEITTLREAFYFSFVNFTSLGYGDVTLDGPAAILGPIEAANGIMTLGLSTSFLIALVSQIMKSNVA